MAVVIAATSEPKSMRRPKEWDAQVEDAYRFQLAGYRDEREYLAHNKGESVERWPDTQFVKKLQRKKDGYFYYYNRLRECPDKDINKCKIYAYE